MTSSEILLLTILLIVSGFLIFGRLRADLIALCALVTVGLTGLVNARDVSSGFSSSAVITILGISVISEGLQETGVTRRMGRTMLRVAGRREWALVLVTVLTAAFLSLFMNNIAAAGVMMPAVIGLSRQTRTPPSKLLMPLAFGTILGGMATLLTTSNIIVSGALRDAGYRPFGLLDFLPIGILVIVAGTIYLVLIGRWLLPSQYPAGAAARAQRLHAELESIYGIRNNLCEVEVKAGSCMAGLSLIGGDWSRRLGLTIVGLKRGGKIQIGPSGEDIIHEGDILLAQGAPVPAAVEDCGLRVLEESTIPQTLSDESVMLSELAVSPRASIAGHSLSEIHFREKYHLSVLAIWREGRPIHEGLADAPLRFGDALLVQGAPSRVRLLRDEQDFLLLEEDPEAVWKPRRAWLASLITVCALGIAALGWFPVPEVSLAGALLMVLTGCLSVDSVYRSVEWKAMFLIAGMWPLGLAMRSTGLADTLAHTIIQTVSGAGPLALAVMLLLTGLVLAQLLGAQVASIVLTPIGLTMAVTLGSDPRALGMAVALGCSLAFLTPLGHPVNMLVMGSGGYSFRDYIRVGGPLTLIVLGMIILGLFLFWGIY
jgi:di/tricarboxylate transporter